MKRTLLFLAVLFAMVLMAMPAMAKNPKSPADFNGLDKGKSEKMHLYLYEKDPADWSVVEDGAWGKMTYDTDKFVFNGHLLEVGSEYTLIRYTDPWPGHPVICLGSGVSDEAGNIHLMGDMENGGFKVWLVLKNDVDCGEAKKMTAWNPEEYLFEYNLIEGWEHVETIPVNANNPSLTRSSEVLESGEEYLFRVMGTAFAGDTIDFDAKYSITNRIAGDTWTDLVSGYTGYGPTLLDLFIDGSPVDWGAYNDSHTYWHHYTGDGTTVEFNIYDVWYPNNTGSLIVDIYKL